MALWLHTLTSTLTFQCHHSLALLPCTNDLTTPVPQFPLPLLLIFPFKSLTHRGCGHVQVT